MLVRPARSDDVRAVEQVRVDGWRAAYRGLVPDAFLDAFAVDEERVAWREADLARTDRDSVTLVAEDAGAVVGAAFLLPTRSDDLDPVTTAELASLYVAPAAWSQGVGGALLDAGFAAMPQPLQVLWTLQANRRARRFYEARGFVADGATQVLDLGGPVVEVRYRRTRPSRL